jgi:hypothetical protein
MVGLELLDRNRDAVADLDRRFPFCRLFVGLL